MRNLRRGITVALVLCLILALALPVMADDLAKRQAEYQKIQQQIQSIEQTIRSNNQQSKSVGSEILRLDREITEAEQQLGYLENRLATTKMEITATEQDLGEAEKSLSFRQDMLKTRIRALYERGSVSYLEVLLSARSFTDLVNRLGLLKQVVNQDVNVVESIKVEKARIEERKALLEAKRQELAGLYQQTERERTQMASRMANRAAYQRQLSSDKAEYEKALRDLQATERELERLIREAQQNNPGGAQGTGSLRWPTPGYTRVTSRFGPRTHPIFGGSSHHDGIDIGAPMGANIVAADSGRVLFSGWMNGYGQTVILDHGNGRSTLYAHASVLLVKTNDTVIKGQNIARVGSTGWSTGPHLHFEVRNNGVKQNPLNYVKP